MRLPMLRQKRRYDPTQIQRRRYIPFALNPKRSENKIDDTANEWEESQIDINRFFDMIRGDPQIKPWNLRWRAKRDYRNMVKLFRRAFSNEGLGKLFKRDLDLGKAKRLGKGAFLHDYFVEDNSLNKRLGQDQSVEGDVLYPIRFARMKKHMDHFGRSMLSKYDGNANLRSDLKEKDNFKYSSENENDVECSEKCNEKMIRPRLIRPWPRPRFSKRLDEMDASGFNGDTWNSKL